MPGTTVAIGWAYPSSARAEHFGFKRTGCYYLSFNGIHKTTFGDCYQSVAAAEAAADETGLPWDPSYLRFPLPGSRFAVNAEELQP